MKKLFSTLSFLALVLGFSASLSGQTVGTLTFSFMPIAKAPTYNGNSQHVLAVWIQTSAGAFVKTKIRRAGGGTADHLPTWAVNSGGTAANCMSAACNVVDGSTGATLASWAASTITWDGNMGPAASGTLQPDGVYKVTIQETWNHGSTGTAITSYTFTKGPAQDLQNLAGDANFSGIYINWQPALPAGVEKNSADNSLINVYPNPTNGVFNVDFKNASNIKVINTLGVVVYDEKIEAQTSGTKSIDLSNFTNGIYFINISNTEGSTSNHKIILNK